MIAQRHSLLLLLFALLLLGCHQAEAQRIRATGGVTFYAGPNGTDDGNNCLSPANPCTLHGAHSVAQRDWDLPGCVIRLADGIYTRGVSIAGQYVGTHFCQVFGHVDQDGVCLDRTAVVINDPRAAFAIEDGMMTSIACLTVMGGFGFYGRQHVVIDLANVACDQVSQCIALTHFAQATVVGDIWISGDSVCFACADRKSQLDFANNAQVVVTKPVTVSWFIQALAKSDVNFTPGTTVVSPQFLAGSQCYPNLRGAIVTNGMALPCTIYQPAGSDGNVY